MLYFFQSWKEAVSVLNPKNAKLFFLVTFKTIIQSYKIVVRDWGWLLLVIIAFYFIDFRFFNPTSAKLFFILISVAWLILIFGVYLIIRPSIKRKGYIYYCDYMRYFPYFVLFSLVIQLIPHMLLLLFSKIIHNASNIHSIFYILFSPFQLMPIFISMLIAPDLIPLYASPLLTFLILFLLDTNGSIAQVGKAVINAFKMCAYNYPFCLLVFACFVFCSLAGQWVIIKFLDVRYHGFITIFSRLLLPIPISVFTNFYTKRIHDQFTLYFPQAIKE